MTDLFEWLAGDWRDAVFVALSTSLIYLSVVVGLRLGERRTLTEMAPYDLAVAVALGSVIGRTATTADPSYARGTAAVITLLGCLHALSIAQVRFRLARRLTYRQPIELVRDGKVSNAALRCAHMTDEDLQMVVRERGRAAVTDAALVLLESRGAFSVLATSPKRARQGGAGG